ncbi:lysophospholipid acyltransferase family protein [Luteipulveratus halotolerans]|uniref:Acyltransferase n=1 Tax=Luteipulveratus halotolerans TaxID=1631356 RepID=A0A0L6CPH3_9MICO|nr:lysophospholipid acyltransferase family protein [Luteipulveratus halotolerans]KNX39666.1 acyltransferase [Luteipulveratus halotolerans]KNX39709.1 acyltransferase [Luteipulveratus halotolerans]
MTDRAGTGGSPVAVRPPATGLRRHVRNAAGFALVWGASKVPHRVSFVRSAGIPRTGPVLVVANHLSMTEALALARTVIGHRRFPHALAMAEVFSWPVVGWLARQTGQIPVHRGTEAAAHALEVAAARLEHGQVVVIYPEGRLTREPDLRPGPGKTGAARLALNHPHVPVVPVGMWGPRPGSRHIWHRHRAHLVVGDPIDLTRWANRGNDTAAVAEATAAIMAAITALVETARGAPFDTSGAGADLTPPPRSTSN